MIYACQRKTRERERKKPLRKCDDETDRRKSGGSDGDKTCPTKWHGEDKRKTQELESHFDEQQRHSLIRFRRNSPTFSSTLDTTNNKLISDNFIYPLFCCSYNFRSSFSYWSRNNTRRDYQPKQPTVGTPESNDRALLSFYLDDFRHITAPCSLRAVDPWEPKSSALQQRWRRCKQYSHQPISVANDASRSNATSNRFIQRTKEATATTSAQSESLQRDVFQTETSLDADQRTSYSKWRYSWKSRRTSSTTVR